MDGQGVAVGVEASQAAGSPTHAQCVTSLSIGAREASFLIGRVGSESDGGRRAQFGSLSR